MLPATFDVSAPTPLDHHPVQVILDTTGVSPCGITARVDGVDAPTWTESGTCGTTETRVWFPVTTSTGRSTVELRVADPPAGGAGVFPFFEDFGGAALDADWIAEGAAPTVVGGTVQTVGAFSLRSADPIVGRDQTVVVRLIATPGTDDDVELALGTFADGEPDVTRRSFDGLSYTTWEQSAFLTGGDGALCSSADLAPFLPPALHQWRRLALTWTPGSSPLASLETVEGTFPDAAGSGCAHDVDFGEPAHLLVVPDAFDAGALGDRRLDFVFVTPLRADVTVTERPPGDTGDTGVGDSGPGGSGAGGTGAGGSGGTGSGTGGTGAGGSGGTGSGGTGGPGETGGTGATDTGAADTGGLADAGCGCATGEVGAAPGLLLALLAVRRRRGA